MRSQILLYDGLQRCAYLPGQVARLPLYAQRRRLDPIETDAAFAAGERRNGRSLYKTACPTCRACEPLRVLVDEFEPTKSQRRVLRRWEGQRVEIGEPGLTTAHLTLFNRHKSERDLAEDGEGPFGADDYRAWLVHTCVHTQEMRYYLDDRLVGVGIVDLGAEGLSSVYFYFDPDPEVARLSPGVWSVLREIAYAKATGRKYVYLGLYVGDCRHLAYKADYTPHERLIDGDWRRTDRG